MFFGRGDKPNLRKAFEAVADQGSLTRYRRRLSGLGFYPAPPFPTVDNRVMDYDVLSSLPVFLAAAIAKGDNQLTYQTKK